MGGIYIAELLREAGIEARVNLKLDIIRSEKMLIVASASTLSALYKKTCGELSDDPNIHLEMEALLKEGYEVLSNEQALSPYEHVEEMLYKTLLANKDSYTSLCQDIMSGRQTEIDFATGVIIELGKKHGLPTPGHNLIYERIKKLEQENQEGRMMGYRKM